MPLKTLGQTNSKRSLLIFDFFEIDADLPKHRKPPEGQKAGGAFRRSRNSLAYTPEDLEDADSESEGTLTFAGQGLFKSVVGAASNGAEKPEPWWKRLFNRKPAPPPPEPAPTSVIEVFNQIKMSHAELRIWDERDRALCDLIEQAEATGQKEMLLRLKDAQAVRTFENALYAKGFRKYLTEAQLLEFTAKCEKGLCLDWVRAFLRPIPADVVAAKVKCDEARLFDNYVVLHFDPTGTATSREARAEEVAKRRDPILFGVVKGSRKLYFVGDWQDELCDLTFQQIVDKLGKPLEFPADPRAVE